MFRGKWFAKLTLPHLLFGFRRGVLFKGGVSTNPIAETRIPVELGGKQYTMIFDMNGSVAYEEATGKFFLDTVASLYDAMRPAVEARQRAEIAALEAGKMPGADFTLAPISVSGMDILRKVPMKDLRALIWAAIHEYDKDDNPTWPLTLNQVGRVLKIEDIPRIFTGFLKGQVKNSPTAAEMGESPVPVLVKPNGSAEHLKIDTAAGGEQSISLPEDAFT